MSEGRRLLAIGALLALGALVCFSHVWGEPAKKPDKPIITLPPAPNEVRGIDDVNTSRFIGVPVVAYQPAEGDALFALQLKPDLDKADPRPRDIAVVVDTSASQAQGAFGKAQALLEALVGKMAAGDKLAIRTANIKSKDLSNGFQRAEAAKEAVANLKQEVPFGATDLKEALSSAVRSFNSEAGRQKVILFLGDGMSVLNPITHDVRTNLISQMVEAEIGFFPVPLGIRLDPQTLHGFATGTGGAAVRVLPGEKDEATVERLLDTVSVPVMYPTKFETLGNVAEVMPKRLPPLRSDAPTLVVGKVKGGDKIGIKVTGKVAGKEVTKEKAEDLPPCENENFFLTSLVSQWRDEADAPALLRADRALASVEQMTQLARVDLVAQAEWAVEEDKWEVAEKLYQAAASVDPHDIDVKAGLDVVRKLRSGAVTREQLRDALRPKAGDTVTRLTVSKDNKVIKEVIAKTAREQQEPVPQNNVNPIVPQNPADILAEAKARQAVEDQRMQQIVRDAVNQANRTLPTDPEGARALIKNTLDGVRNNPDVSDRIRGTLVRTLEQNLASVERAGVQIQRSMDEQMARVAEARARMFNEATVLAAQERTRERVRVFHNLMDMAREIEAQEQAQAIRSDLVNQGLPVPPGVTAGYRIAQSAYHLRELRELQRLREDRFLLTMLSVEKSHIPFPDEPPIEFPPPAVWRKLTDLRKSRYEASNLGDDVPKRTYELRDKMSDPVDKFDGFADARTTLEEALDYLQKRYGLTFDINDDAFKSEKVQDVLGTGITEKQAIREMRNVSLDTILRKILARVPSESGVTYIIRRESIEITTGNAAKSERVVRVYPVGDLVIPIPNAVNTIALQNSATIFGQFGAAGAGGLVGLQVGGQLGGGLQFGGVQLGLQIGGVQLGLQIGGIQLGGGLQLGGLQLGGVQVGGLQQLGGNLNLGAQGGQNNLGVGGGQLGFQGGQLGQFGNLGGQFGFQGGDMSQMLVLLIKQTVGTPRDWAPPQGINLIGNPNPGAPPDNPNQDPDGNDLGYWPPALALVVKAPSRIHTRVGTNVLSPAAPPGGLMGKGGDLRDGVVRIGDKPKEPKPGDKVVENKPRPKLPMEDADPTKVWQEALAKGVAEPGLIIACADYFVQAKKWEHAAEFLKANLRQGVVVKPWVFESLAIALKEGKGSPEDVERAEVSEADLEPMDADGFLRAAQALANRSLHEHALAFTRQAAILSPNTPHAYSDALDYAIKIKDPKEKAEAVEWAAGNLMKRDWPVDNTKLQLKAKDVLNGTVKTLAVENKSAAEKLESSVSQSRERDLVIRLQWQGQADLDLRVTEPTGSSCSWLNRQTVGGGTLLGDTLTEPNKETYVAAQAFVGEYKVMVERNWGTPLGDKARLEIVRHQGTAQETTELVTVNLNTNHILTVKLDQGRRTTASTVPPPGAQKKPAEVAEMGGIDKVFNQLRALSEGSQPSVGGGGDVGGFGKQAAPVRPKAADQPIDPTRDQVAYQTRVSPFVPNSLNLAAQAVITGDRRYVRLSLNPMFNVVSGVNSVPVLRNSLIPGGRQFPTQP